MITIQTHRIRPIVHGISGIRDATASSEHLYLLVDGALQALRWDNLDGDAETIALPRAYAGIDYDAKEACFWAVSAAGNTLHRLDKQFCERASTRLQSGGLRRQLPCGLCSDCGDGRIGIAYPSQTACVARENGYATWQDEDNDKCPRIASLCHGSCKLTAYTERGLQLLSISARCDSEDQVTLCIPRGYVLLSIVPHRGPCTAGCAFWLLLRPKCGHALAVQHICVHFAEDGALCPPVPPCPPIPPCPPEPPCPPCPPCPPKPPCPPCEHCRCCGAPCCGSCCGGLCPRCALHCAKYEVIHSIALEEAGIAHILNAEGEKLQKVVALDSTVDQLLCTNESVKRTISQLVLLEGQLFSKLEAVVRGDCPCSAPLSED